MDKGTRRGTALERLEAFVGEWKVETTLPGAEGLVGRTVFEPLLGGQFLIQRSEIPHPDAPDSTAIISFDPDDGSFAQHYFDSRGVVRIYAMSFDDGVWGLVREAPDFSPLKFSQRFRGTFNEGRSIIRGRWEIADDGVSWKTDFDLTYTRVD